MKKLIIAIAFLAACASDELVTSAQTADLSWEGCSPGSGVYTPFADPSTVTTGTAASLTWPGEDLQAYGAPVTIECSSGMSAVSKEDVTSGCLSTVFKGAGNIYTRGVVGSDVFRMVALGRAAPTDQPYAWTTQTAETRFNWHIQTNTINDPGFKLFARYQSEDTLLVAGFWADGRAQIKKKICGTYTTLATTTLAFPVVDVWHTAKFIANGPNLSLVLNNLTVLTATDLTLSWGTTGVRVDSFDGSYLDDIKTY